MGIFWLWALVFFTRASLAENDGSAYLVTGEGYEIVRPDALTYEGVLARYGQEDSERLRTIAGFFGLDGLSHFLSTGDLLALAGIQLPVDASLPAVATAAQKLAKVESVEDQMRRYVRPAASQLLSASPNREPFFRVERVIGNPSSELEFDGEKRTDQNFARRFGTDLTQYYRILIYEILSQNAAPMYHESALGNAFEWMPERDREAVAEYATRVAKRLRTDTFNAIRQQRAYRVVRWWRVGKSGCSAFGTFLMNRAIRSVSVE